jgi:hypothetical protein
MGFPGERPFFGLGSGRYSGFVVLDGKVKGIWWFEYLREIGLAICLISLFLSNFYDGVILAIF